MRSISRIAVGESLDIPTGPLYHTQGRDIGEMTGYHVCHLISINFFSVPTAGCQKR
jgi:hypothetical protein